MKLLLGGILLAAGFAALPLVTQRNDLLNLGVQIFLAVALAQSWNLLGGYAGQITLGHAAFFGLGALVTRMLWVGGAPLYLALAAGALVATAFGVLIGLPAFRLRGAYFSIGTLALAEILRITVGNLMPEISTIPAAALASYNILPRYYLTLLLPCSASPWSRYWLVLVSVWEYGQFGRMRPPLKLPESALLNISSWL
jgi:ABC-type branched-subunit amino acid transport system permease subunit